MATRCQRALEMRGKTQDIVCSRDSQGKTCRNPGGNLSGKLGLNFQGDPERGYWPSGV